MRKIKPKSLEVADIPTSIQLPQNEKNKKDRFTQNEGKRETTHQRRLEVIDLQHFPNKNEFSERYKQEDVKEKLQTLYQCKCAYCEQYSESWQVEHYRPKNGGYYWLAYSWDNLLYCCPTCNQFKSKKFEIRGEKAVYQTHHLPEIHELCQKYNQIEKPLLLHPEYDDAEADFVFDRNGKILLEKIENKRLAYTIKTCNLHRKSLDDRRQELITDALMKDINAVVSKNSDNQEIMIIKINALLEAFLVKCERETEEFTIFRKYFVKHFFNEIINEVLG